MSPSQRVCVSSANPWRVFRSALKVPVGREATEAADVPGADSRISSERTDRHADVAGIEVTPRERALLERIE
jgi:hypothetical protein